MPPILQYPIGSVLQFTSGQYSDHGTRGLIVAVKNLDLPKLAQEMMQGKEAWECYDAHYDFASWLVAKGYAMPVDCNEVHLGSCGGWEPEFGVKDNA